MGTAGCKPFLKNLYDYKITHLYKSIQEIYKMKYCVYKHTSPSGKVYIGITRNDPIKRWQNGTAHCWIDCSIQQVCS